MIEYFDDEASNLSLLTDRQRLEYVIQRGQQTNRLPEDQRIDNNKVEGCQSNAYLLVSTANNEVTVRTDADSKVVRGYLAFLSEGFTGEKPQTVIDEAEQSVKAFVDKGNLSSTFTPNRSDAFTNTVDAIVNELKQG